MFAGVVNGSIAVAHFRLYARLRLASLLAPFDFQDLILLRIDFFAVPHGDRVDDDDGCGGGVKVSLDSEAVGSSAVAVRPSFAAGAVS
jgi:hypothetical protein